MATTGSPSATTMARRGQPLRTRGQTYGRPCLSPAWYNSPPGHTRTAPQTYTMSVDRVNVHARQEEERDKSFWHPSPVFLQADLGISCCLDVATTPTASADCLAQWLFSTHTTASTRSCCSPVVCLVLWHSRELVGLVDYSQFSLLGIRQIFIFF